MMSPESTAGVDNTVEILDGQPSAQPLVILHNKQQSVNLSGQQQGPAAAMKAIEGHGDFLAVPVHGSPGTRHENPRAIAPESLSACESGLPCRLSPKERL